MHQIELWQGTQDIHMPVVIQLQASTSQSEKPVVPIKAEDVALWLPSSLLASNEMLTGLCN